jgi:hypothetical protein
MDCFAREVANLHAVRRVIRGLDDVSRVDFVRGLIESGTGGPDDWLLTARDASCHRSATGPYGSFSVVAVLANRTQCRRRYIPQCAPG